MLPFLFTALLCLPLVSDLRLLIPFAFPSHPHFTLTDAPLFHSKDADGFSPIHTLRGADWRGKDCDDRNANVRPGRIPDNSDTVYDSNCNGIYGVDPKTNKPYEELLCSDTKQQGVIVLGDSASAHFHVQPQYLNVTAWDSTTFSRILPVLENEFDWPLFSSTTGFEDTRTMAPDINGPSNSSYQV